MKQLRCLAPFLALLALAALFLILPETPNIFECKKCSPNDPYMSLIGTGYFALLAAVALLFPAFPSSKIAKAGLIWAVLLALVLTYMKLPNWCILCLIAHVCNILIWAIWMIGIPARNRAVPLHLSVRLYLTIFSPLSMIALFSSLNLTFMAYPLKKNHSISSSGFQSGDILPTFSAKTISGKSITSSTLSSRLIINFISPSCSHCKEQLLILNTIITELSDSYRIINVSPSLTSELPEYSPNTEWIEDTEGKLRKLFKVSGYPTMFLVQKDSRIAEIISGVPEQLKVQLLSTVASQSNN